MAGWAQKIIGALSGNMAEVTADGAIRTAGPKGQGYMPIRPDHAGYTLDAFERMRVSQPKVAFEYSFANGALPAMWEATAVGAGTLTQNTTAFHTELNSTTAAGTGYWLQSFQHIRYIPGVSTLARLTFNFNGLTANLRQRFGLFTDQGTYPSTAGDGLYLEVDGTSVSVVRRYLTGGGSGAEERVPQGSWNMDKLNGSGASGITIDWTKTQHLVIEFQYLGVGTIRFGFETTLGVVWAHEMVSVNSLSVAWARTGSLPVRAEIHTTGATAVAGKLILCNVCVHQEADVLNDRPWRHFGSTSGAALRVGGLAVGLYPVVALRANVTNDITKRTMFQPTKVNLLVQAAATGPVAMQWALLALPTPMTGATYAGTAGASSFVGVDQLATAATAVTGTTLASGVLPNAVGTYQIDFLEQLNNGVRAGQNAAGSLTISGANALCFAYGPLITAATVGASVAASINWREMV